MPKAIAEKPFNIHPIPNQCIKATFSKMGWHDKAPYFFFEILEYKTAPTTAGNQRPKVRDQQDKEFVLVFLEVFPTSERDAEEWQLEY